MEAATSLSPPAAGSMRSSRRAALSTLSTGFGTAWGVAVDGSGNLYVSDRYSNNLVEELETGAVNFGTAAIGATSAAIPLTFAFDSGGTIGNPVALTSGAANRDFADAGTGTCTTNGTGHTYNTGDTCTVNVTVTPRFAGLRSGAVLLQDGSGNTLTTAYVHGIGSGPQAAFGPGIISTLAGNGTQGYNGDTIAASTAELNGPAGVATDGAGNFYIADYNNNRIRKVTPDGTITTVAGNGTGGFSGDGGLATGAQLRQPERVALDGAGNLYIADIGNGRVRKVTPAGIISTVAGGGHGCTGQTDSLGMAVRPPVRDSRPIPLRWMVAATFT